MCSSDIEIRPAQRKLHCRGCDKEVGTGESVLYTHSVRNRGQHIYFCMSCVDEIVGLRLREVVPNLADPILTGIKE